MKRLFLLALVMSTLPTMCFATSIEYAIRGSLGAHNATLAGNAAVGSFFTLTSPLVNNSLSVIGTITLTTGSLVATSNPSVLAFTGGNLSLMSGGSVIYHSSFSSGFITLLGGSNFSISGILTNGTALITDKNGDIRGETLITDEPGTLGLVLTGTGLAGLAVIARRKKQRSLSV